MPETPETPKKPLSSREEIAFYYDKALDILTSTGHVKSGEYIKDVLVENCEAQMEWHEGLSTFLNHIKEQGLQIEAPVENMQKLSDNLFRLRFLMKMIHAVGLGRYEEQILGLEIEKQWGRIPTVPPAAPTVPRTAPPQQGAPATGGTVRDYRKR